MSLVEPEHTAIIGLNGDNTNRAWAKRPLEADFATSKWKKTSNVMHAFKALAFSNHGDFGLETRS
jgi:hypothetical protein